jgi:hypothetical protein
MKKLYATLSGEENVSILGLLAAFLLGIIAAFIWHCLI